MSTEKHGKTPDILQPLRLPNSDPKAPNSHAHEYHNGTRVAECTENPLWYLQQRRITITSDPEGSHRDDEYALRWDETKESLSNEEILESAEYDEHWETVDVYLSRDEAQKFGEATKHRYTMGYRVWSKPINPENSLAFLLNGVVALVDSKPWLLTLEYSSTGGRKTLTKQLSHRDAAVLLLAANHANLHSGMEKHFHELRMEGNWKLHIWKMEEVK